jgi:hypothetical protein
MRHTHYTFTHIARSLTAFALLAALIVPALGSVNLHVLGTHATGVFGAGAAEIVAHDPITQRLFVVNGAESSIDVLSIAQGGVPTFLFSIDVSPYGNQANSVDVCNGLVAAAVEGATRANKGTVVFFNAFGQHLKTVGAGALPDMLTFTPKCDKVLVANEGEPTSYNQPNSVDPEGSVTIVDLQGGLNNATATNVDFKSFNGTNFGKLVRIFGPNATVAQDLEPEYIAYDEATNTARVTLQENNAVAVLDLATKRFTRIQGLGYKDHLLTANKLDASDRDVPGSSNNGIINIRNWPVYGMFQPDAIAAFRAGGRTYYLTANEGDARDYTGFAEEARGGSLTLDAAAFAAKGFFDVGPGTSGLRHPDNLGRLNFTSTLGNTDGDAEYEELYAFGARSFSIWNQDGKLVWDSGDALEQITATAYPMFFNASNDNNNFDDRSDNKGPEPEAATVGQAYGRTYAFIGLERIGGIVVYDVTDPHSPTFVQYINNRNFLAAVDTAAAKDLGPEGIHFIPANESPTGLPLIAVANEVSGTTTVYELRQSIVSR